MEEVQILICGNFQKKEIMNETEKLNSDFNLNLSIKDFSNSSPIQNIEYYFSLINDIQYFNVFVLNYEKKEEIFDFFKSFNTEEWGITNECYPFFMICKQILSKNEGKKYINDLNNSKKDLYKIKFGNILFYNDIKAQNAESFQKNIINIYNCYNQDYKCYDDSKESINILLIGVKNSGKSTLINRLLGETRALSMENHYTSKMNLYKHTKYPIVFYDISGFNENEDDEILEVNSKIDEFNKIYKNIKHKIHTIFYVIDCNSARILQNKEKQLMENLFEKNIPIFIVGQKAEKTNIKNFIRKTKFELNTLSNNYRKKIETLKNRIFCLDTSKESLLNLLESVYYNEFILSKNVNEEIIKINNEELSIRKASENEIITHNDELDEKEDNLIQTFDLIKKSIFFNDLTELFNKVSNNIKNIKDKYKKDSYYIFKPDINEIIKEIENEFLEIFDEDDIKSIMNDQQNDFNDKIEKDANKFNLVAGGTGGFGLISTIVAVFGFSNSILYLILTPFIFIFIDVCLINKKDNELKSTINSEIEKAEKKMQKYYIKKYCQLISNKAEKYNNIINEFNNFIKEFTED